MSLRPLPTRWFEVVTVHGELARVMECLSRTSAVELEARGDASDRLLFSDLAKELAAHREVARHYQAYWPPAVLGARRSECLRDILGAARGRIAAWVEQADAIITTIERLSQDAINLVQLRAVLSAGGSDFPNPHLLAGAGPQLQVRLLVLPAEGRLREIPSLVLFKLWNGPDANRVLLVGRQADIEAVDAQLPGLKGRVLELPPWLPPVASDAVSAISERLAELSKKRGELTAELTISSDRLQIARALGDIELIEWFSRNAKDLRGSERLAWVTGWTSDPTGTALRRALDGRHLRYVLRLADPPEGATAPLVLNNPVWARAFEILTRMLGTPGRTESDPSQIVTFMASFIFGFMFGDVGQGAVVCLVGLLLGQRIPFLRMLVPGGAAAAFFGGLFGSVFCRDDLIPALWVRPLAEPVKLLLAAILVGVVVIAIGLALDAMQMHWRGEAVRWWGQRLGLPAAYAGLLLSLIRPEGLLIAAVGGCWYIVGAAALPRSGRLAAISEAVAEFVEQSLRLLINTVSFARIGAFALAHAGLSVAVIEIAGASGHVGYWMVLTIGNVLIIALEGIVVSIQTTRLMLFEFFIRFLTGSGRKFRPLSPPVTASSDLAEVDLGGTS